MNKKAIIQGLLYVSGDEGIELNAIKRVLNISVDEIREIINELKKQYDSDENCGLTIKIYGSSYYLLTKPEIKQDIAKLVDIKLKNPLSASLLETLSIIAYNHPCTQSKIEEIRGMNSDNILKKLIDLQLIENIGRAEAVGRPYLYELTQKFFNLFGIKNLNELPKINLDININENDLDFFDSNRFDE